MSNGMVRKSLRGPWVLPLLAMSMPAIAQYNAAPPPGEPPAASPGARVDGLNVYPKNGQTQEQLWADRYECYRWSKNQSGFDPIQQPAGVPPNENVPRLEQYRRAMIACLEARGYSVRYAAPPPNAPPPYGERPHVEHYSPPVPQLKYHPLAVQIDGGYSITTGTTSQYISDGANIGLGFTWFPTSALPLGLRVDGSYSWFRVTNQFLYLNTTGFNRGDVNIYGGDADVQVDLAHRSSRAKLYLFGGVGWYREQTELRHVALVAGTICFTFFCEPAIFPVVTARQRTTSSWHNSWNGGIGWEIWGAERTSFFIEARYQRIAPYGSKMQFVPIRLGLRF